MPATRRRNRVEYETVQVPIARALETLGFDVTQLSQPQRVIATAGVPDLYVRHARWGIRAFIECKRPDQRSKVRGGCSVAQWAWHQSEREAGGVVILAYELVDVIAELKRLGVPVQ